MGTVIALIILLAIVVGIGEAIAPLIAVMFLVGILCFIICMMASASKESQKKYGSEKTQKDTTFKHSQIEITDANVVFETIKALEFVTHQPKGVGATAIVAIGLIKDVEALEPSNEHIKKQIHSFHKNYYPVLIQAILSCKKIPWDDEEYNQAWEKLDETMRSLCTALKTIIKENSEGEIAELSVNINLLNSLLSKDGFKEEGRMKL